MVASVTPQREYETIYVIRPDVDDKSAKDLMLKMKEILANHGGKNIKVSCWGRKRLAWERDKHQRGIYVHHAYLGNPGAVKAFEHMLDLDESVILRQSIMVNAVVDPETRPELADELDAPVIREPRRDMGYSEHGYRRGGHGDDMDFDNPMMMNDDAEGDL